MSTPQEIINLVLPAVYAHHEPNQDYEIDIRVENDAVVAVLWLREPKKAERTCLLAKDEIESDEWKIHFAPRFRALVARGKECAEQYKNARGAEK